MAGSNNVDMMTYKIADVVAALLVLPLSKIHSHAAWLSVAAL